MPLAPAVTDLESLKGHSSLARLLAWNAAARVDVAALSPVKPRQGLQRHADIEVAAHAENSASDFSERTASDSIIEQARGQRPQFSHPAEGRVLRIEVHKVPHPVFRGGTAGQDRWNNSRTEAEERAQRLLVRQKNYQFHPDTETAFRKRR